MNRNDLIFGSVKLPLILGNKRNHIGYAVVRLNGNNLEITLHGLTEVGASGTFGAFTFTEPSAFPNNSNLHSGQANMTALGAPYGSSNSHNKNAANTVSIPAPASGDFYLYIHCDNVRFYKPQ